MNFAAPVVITGPSATMNDPPATFEGTQNVAKAVTNPLFGVALPSYSIRAHTTLGASEFFVDRNAPALFRGFSGSFTVPSAFSTTTFDQVLLGATAHVGTTGNVVPPPAISVTAVPEPGALMVGALLGAGLARGRGRRGGA